MSNERLQKVLAHQGVASRRHVEQMIEAGRITVNGKKAILGQRVSPACKIKVDDKPIAMKAQTKHMLIYHKPIGQVCSRKPEPHQESIFKSLPELDEGRWLSVGRLDINTSGLLILTNDGETLQKMQHPSFGFEREYHVRAYGQYTTDILKQLKSKMALEDGDAEFLSIEHISSRGGNHWFKVTLSEGRNRLVRRMFEHVGLEINRLMRTRFGSTLLPRDLKPGQYRALS